MFMMKENLVNKNLVNLTTYGRHKKKKKTKKRADSYRRLILVSITRRNSPKSKIKNCVGFVNF